MEWAEAYRLMVELCRDPSSHVAAALEGWQRPVSDTAMAVADLFDLQHRSKSKKRNPKPYPRVWDKAPVKHGNRAVSLAEWKRMKEARRG